MAARESSTNESKTAAGAHVHLHPLVLMNITDHHTRASLGGDMHDRVIGALFGEQRGLDSVIMNSIEMHFDVAPAEQGAHAIINADFVRKQEEMHQVVYPKQAFQGWYAVGDAALPAHMATHKALVELGYTNPFFLLLNERIDEGAKELPLSIYEGQVAMGGVGGAPRHVFVRQAFAIATTESERIAIEHVAKNTPVGGDESVLTPHLQNLQRSVSRLRSRTQQLLAYLRGVEQGSFPRDEALLRQVSAICRQLPALDPAAFKDSFVSEYVDSQLVTLLASITKGTKTLSEVTDKVQAGYVDSGSGRRGKY